MKFKFKQIIGMSVDITKYWHEWRHCRLCTLVMALADQVYSHSQCTVHKYCRNGKKVTENEIKNEIKVQTKYWHECWHCSCQHSTKIKKVKLLNRKIEIENEVTENEIKNEIYVKTKYWHECWHCSCWHE